MTKLRRKRLASILGAPIHAAMAGKCSACMSVISRFCAASPRRDLADLRQRQRAEQELSAVLGNFVLLQEEEHKRIARDLHEGLGQTLTVLGLGLSRLQGMVGKMPEVNEQIERLQAATNTAGQTVSRLAWELRPVGLEELGLSGALLALVEKLRAKTGLRIECHIGNLPDGLPSAAEDALYRTAQEAITNVLRHAGATRVSLLLDTQGGVVRMIIEDDGVGFAWSADALLPQGRHLGLLGMRERLAAVQGTLEIETAPGKGTTLYVAIAL